MLLLSATFGVGTVCMMVATHSGSGLTPDSLHYITAARHLMVGQGLMQAPVDGATVPFILYAPLFPIILSSGGSIFRADPLQVARWLNCMLFGANAALAAYIAY